MTAAGTLALARCVTYRSFANEGTMMSWGQLSYFGSCGENKGERTISPIRR